MSILRLKINNTEIESPYQIAKDLLILNQFSGSGIFISILEKICDSSKLYNKFQQAKHRSNILR